MNKQKTLTILFGVLVAVMVMSCQSDDLEIPVPQTQIQDQRNDDSGSGLVAKYTVSGNAISLKQDGNHPSSFFSSTANQNEFWAFYSNLIPLDARGALRELVLFADEEDGTAAYVAPLDYNDLSKWEMGYNLSFVWTRNGQLNKSETGYTAIHEFAHILTLDDKQVTVSDGCSGFHTGEGCSNSNSYINAFFNNYWADIYQENQRIDEDDEEAYIEFYEKYENRFVTEYASTNPGEDIAESFTMFVVKDLPTSNSIANQKIRFFYDYDELVVLRDRIRANIDFNFNLSGVVEARSERFRMSLKGKPQL